MADIFWGIFCCFLGISLVFVLVCPSTSRPSQSVSQSVDPRTRRSVVSRRVQEATLRLPNSGVYNPCCQEVPDAIEKSCFKTRIVSNPVI